MLCTAGGVCGKDSTSHGEGCYSLGEHEEGCRDTSNPPCPLPCRWPCSRQLCRQFKCIIAGLKFLQGFAGDCPCFPLPLQERSLLGQGDDPRLCPLQEEGIRHEVLTSFL